MADYYAPQTDREAILATHALAWQTHELLAKHNVPALDKRVARIEMLGKAGVALLSAAGVAIGVANFVLKVV